MTKFLLLSSTIIALASCNATGNDIPIPPPALPQDTFSSLVMDYTCDEGKHLSVAYLNGDEALSHAILLLDGKLVPMTQGISGSGVRYVADEKGSDLIWHTKGNWGILYREAAQNGGILFDNCKAP